MCTLPLLLSNMRITMKIKEKSKRYLQKYLPIFNLDVAKVSRADMQFFFRVLSRL